MNSSHKMRSALEKLDTEQRHSYFIADSRFPVFLARKEIQFIFMRSNKFLSQNHSSINCLHQIKTTIYFHWWIDSTFKAIDCTSDWKCRRHKTDNGTLDRHHLAIIFVCFASNISARSRSKRRWPLLLIRNRFWEANDDESTSGNKRAKKKKKGKRITPSPVRQSKQRPVWVTTNALQTTAIRQQTNKMKWWNGAH